MPIGGLGAANGVAKLSGEWWGSIYQKTKGLQQRMAKGKGRPLGARGYELGTEEAGNYNHNFPQEGGNLPAGNSIQTIRPRVYARQQAHACQLTITSMDELGKNHGSELYVEDWTGTNLKGTRDAALKMENIYGYGNGNARLATVSTGATSTTQTFTGSGAGFDWTRFLRKNMLIQFVDPASGVYRNATPVTITSDPGPFTTTITISASVATTTGDYVVIAGGWNAAPAGLQKIIDNGTLSNAWFQNINRTTHPKYSAVMVNAGAGTNAVSVSTSLLRRTNATLFEAKGTLKRSDYEIWSHEAQWSVYASLGWTLKRYEGKSKSLDLGFTGMEWEGVPWISEHDAPLDKIMFINWDLVWTFENTAWHWDETTGSIWNRIPSSTSGYNMTDRVEGYYRKIYQNGSPDPMGLAMIYNAAVPANYYY